MGALLALALAAGPLPAQAPAQGALLETLNVPPDGTRVASVTQLRQGERYRLVMSGVARLHYVGLYPTPRDEEQDALYCFAHSGDSRPDSESCPNPMGPGFSPFRLDVGGSEGLHPLRFVGFSDIGIGRYPIPLNSAHVYDVTFVAPADGQLGAVFADVRLPYVTQASGGFRIELYGGDVKCGNERQQYTATIVAQPEPGGAPTLTRGTPGNDVIVGTEGPDVILGAGGVDIICGRGGDDLINGGGGKDGVLGEGGNDSLEGGSDGSADVLIGGAGADQMSGGPGADQIRGGLGDDRIDGDAGADLIRGEQGADQLAGGGEDGARDHLSGGPGADRMDGGPGDDGLGGGPGADRMDGGPGYDIFVTGDGADRLDGGRGGGVADFAEVAVDGARGVDVSLTIGAHVSGGFIRMRGIDDVRGTAGNDIIYGNPRANTLEGLGGRDDLVGGGGDDRLSGGRGDDKLFGEEGRDELNGGTGEDFCSQGEFLVGCERRD